MYFIKVIYWFVCLVYHSEIHYSEIQHFDTCSCLKCEETKSTKLSLVKFSFKIILTSETFYLIIAIVIIKVITNISIVSSVFYHYADLLLSW